MPLRDQFLVYLIQNDKCRYSDMFVVIILLVKSTFVFRNNLTADIELKYCNMFHFVSEMQDTYKERSLSFFC